MKKRTVIIIHCACWAVLLLSNMYESYSSGSGYVNAAIKSSGLPAWLFYLIMTQCYLNVSLVAFYGFYFFVGPLLIHKKKYVLGALSIVAVLCSMVITRYLGEFLVLIPFLVFHNYYWHTPGTWYYIKNCIVVSFSYCAFGFSLYAIVLQNRIAREKKEIEKEKIQAELSFLRSQVNPHFLFNTINDVYALTYQKSDDAPVALLKLSSLLRYMLDGGITDKVMLEKELQYLDDYIALQAIGLKKNVFIDFTIEGNTSEHLVVPLLLIPFVENIFKHGLVDNPGKPAVVAIAMHGNNFALTASNYIKHQQKDSTGGIGLKNVQRRLQLLYPGKHNFTIKQEEDSFTATLKIEL